MVLYLKVSYRWYFCYSAYLVQDFTLWHIDRNFEQLLLILSLCGNGLEIIAKQLV